MMDLEAKGYQNALGVNKLDPDSDYSQIDYYLISKQDGFFFVGTALPLNVSQSPMY